MTDPFITAVWAASDGELRVMRDALEDQQLRLEGAGQATTVEYAATLQKLITVIDQQRKRAIHAGAAAERARVIVDGQSPCPECGMVHAPGLGRTCDEWRAIRAR